MIPVLYVMTKQTILADSLRCHDVPILLQHRHKKGGEHGFIVWNPLPLSVTKVCHMNMDASHMPFLHFLHHSYQEFPEKIRKGFHLMLWSQRTCYDQCLNSI